MTRHQLLELMRRADGIVKLRPEYVHRFYPDLHRLNQNRLKRSPRQFIPERWIGSSVRAVNPPPIPSAGVSKLADATEPIMLRDAIRALPLEMLGERVVAKHGAEFRLLVKILDPGEPIVFHLHATDAQLRRMPRHFPGHRFGKDEAYYFLQDVPKGPMPYTHAGLYDGVTRRELIEAVRRGPEYALELSPSIYQEYETGFFVPAGVPHRPGTALTLEIQQPSDVYTLLETRAGGKAMSPRQIHPGFRSLEEAFALIEMQTSRAVGELNSFRLRPEPLRRMSGGEVATIFPAERCRKFAGRRVRVTRSLTYREPSPIVLLVWRGRGKLGERAIRAGDEFFVTHDTAASGIQPENTGDGPLELFSFFPVV